MYAKIENGEIKEIKPRPKWLNDDGTPVTDSFLVQEEGIYPVLYEPPVIDKTKEKLILKPETDWLIKDTYVEAVYSVKNKTLEEVQKENIRKVEKVKNKNLQTMDYTVPSGDTVTVKINEDAPEKPRQSWLSITINKALAAVINNENFSETLIDADDKEHTLTASEWLDFNKKMEERIVGLVKAAKTDMKNIQECTTIDDVLSYTFTVNQ